jgi:cell division septation protein DedD
MARRGSRGGDRVLESRHLIGLFVGVVILCAVFFTLGYVMGRSQYAGAVQAAYAPGRTVVPETDRKRASPKEITPAPAGDWDFYANKNNNELEKPTSAPKPAAPPAASIAMNTAAARPPSAQPRPSRVASQPTRDGSPRMFGGNLILQVAAVMRQSDALAMADALQRKKFPSFVVAPSTDNFYRVQVGPYPDEHAADNAKSALDRAGFKAIIRR